MANAPGYRTRLRFGRPLRPLLADLIAFFASRGIEAYLVGGTLRDALLGRPQHDIDIAVAADPLAVGRQLADALGGHFFPLGPEQGVARIALPEREIHIDLTPLGEGVESDLARRDYTIDAMAAPLPAALSPAGVVVIDPCQIGRASCRERV